MDFSGARLAGRTTWVARLERGALVSLESLERLAGTAERAAALAHLVAAVRASRDALWGFAFPFGLPLELLGGRSGWAAQRALVREHGADPSASLRAGWELGLECVRRARALGGAMHIRRLTDAEARAPFDPYHYRIIYQTFHGIRDVLAPLWRTPGTAVLPYQYRRLPGATRVLVETCPSSTLKRLGLPHQNYKQPTGGPLTLLRRRTRHAILEGIAPLVAIDAGQRRAIMRDPGGDALDAVLAAVGAAHAMATVDHAAIARHARYPREGHLYY